MRRRRSLSPTSPRIPISSYSRSPMPSYWRSQRVTTRTRPEHQYPTASLSPKYWRSKDDAVYDITGGRPVRLFPEAEAEEKRFRQEKMMTDELETFRQEKMKMEEEERVRKRKMKMEEKRAGPRPVSHRVSASPSPPPIERERERVSYDDIDYGIPARDESSVSDSDLDDTREMMYEDFTLSSRSKGLFAVASQHSDSQSSAEMKDERGPFVSTAAKPTPTSETRYRVHHSSYPENGSGGEDPVAELATEAETGSRRMAPLFEWLHMKQPVMNFDAFMNRVEEAPELDSRQKKSILKVLKGISKQFEKPLRVQGGMQGKWMLPNFDQELPESSANEPSMVFLCIPYFSLERYRPASLPENSKAHPKRTLLQTLFSSATKAQDFQQAVTRLPCTPQDHLFHVSPLWTLVVNDSTAPIPYSCGFWPPGLIITCSSHGSSDLMGESVNIISQPTSSSGRDAPNCIELDDGGSQVWLLPLERCRTWFLLNTNLFDVLDDYELEGPRQFHITYNGAALTAEDWPSVFEQARKTTIRLSLRMSSRNFRGYTKSSSEDESDQETQPDDPEVVIMNPSQPLKSKENTNKTKEVNVPPSILDRRRSTKDSKACTPSPNHISREKFHVFTWLAAEKGSENDVSISPQRFTAALDEVHQLLFKESHPNDRRVYRKTFAEMEGEYASPEAVKKLLRSLPSDTENAKEVGRYLWSLLKAATQIFQFFLPLDCYTPSASCYWSAFYNIIEKTSSVQNPETLPPLDRFRDYAKDLAVIKERFSAAEMPFNPQVTIPDKFVVAWIHWCLAILHWNPSKMGPTNHHAGWSKNAIDEGMPPFLRSFQDKPLQEKLAAMPLGVACLLTQQVLKDFTKPHPDIISSYWDYYNQLTRQVDEDPLKRAHQKSINFLKQEIDAITAVLNQQRNVLTDFNRALEQRRDDSYSYLNGAYTVEQNVVDSCIATVEAKVRSFEDMAIAAATLQETNLEMIDSNKDRQEAAVYAFTIVTIIFLPLSFVTGFLGMNTSDVRNMGTKQWIFWAAGVPLTVIIIVAGLAWAGELGNCWTSFWGLFETGSGRRAAVRDRQVPEPPQTYVNQDMGPPMKRRTTGGLVRRRMGMWQPR